MVSTTFSEWGNLSRHRLVAAAEKYEGIVFTYIEGNTLSKLEAAIICIDDAMGQIRLMNMSFP